MDAELDPCPHCGGTVAAIYAGFNWTILHVDQSIKCVDATILSDIPAERDPYEDIAGWNEMAAIWNRRA